MNAIVKIDSQTLDFQLYGWYGDETCNLKNKKRHDQI